MRMTRDNCLFQCDCLSLAISSLPLNLIWGTGRRSGYSTHEDQTHINGRLATDCLTWWQCTHLGFDTAQGGARHNYLVQCNAHECKQSCSLLIVCNATAKTKRQQKRQRTNNNNKKATTAPPSPSPPLPPPPYPPPPHETHLWYITVLFCVMDETSSVCSLVLLWPKRKQTNKQRNWYKQERNITSSIVVVFKDFMQLTRISEFTFLIFCFVISFVLYSFHFLFRFRTKLTQGIKTIWQNAEQKEKIQRQISSGT